MKKLLGIAACAALALSCLATPVKAATQINAEEQRLLDYISSGFTIQGDSYHFSVESEEYQALYDLLAIEGVDLTKEEVDTVKESAKNTISYLTINYDKLVTDEEYAAMFSDVINLATPGLSVLGVKVEYDAISDILTVKTISGEVLLTIEDYLFNSEESQLPLPTPGKGPKLENTGENFTSTYALIGGLAVILAGAGIYTLRKKEALN